MHEQPNKQTDKQTINQPRKQTSQSTNQMQKQTNKKPNKQSNKQTNQQTNNPHQLNSIYENIELYLIKLVHHSWSTKDCKVSQLLMVCKGCTAQS